MYLLMHLGSKPGVLQCPPPWNNIVLDVPIRRNTYTICTSKSQILQIHPTLNYLLEILGPSPSACRNFSCWFSAFCSSPSLGTFFYLEYLSKIFLGLGNCLKETSSQIQQLLVGFHDKYASLDFNFLTKIKKICRSVPCSIIYLNFQDQAPWLP